MATVPTTTPVLTAKTAPKPRPPALTHFIGLSLVTPASRPQLQSSIERFHETAKAKPELLISEKIASHAIRPVDSIHLTICAMSLPAKEPEKLQDVLKVLRELDLERLWREAQKSDEGQKKPRPQAEDQQQSTSKCSANENVHQESDSETGQVPPLTVTLKGLSSMRSPKSTSVIYAPPFDPTGSLQRFGTSIREAFRSFLPDPRLPPADPGLAEAAEALSVVTPDANTPSSIEQADATSAQEPSSGPSTLHNPVTPPPPSNRAKKRAAKNELPHLLMHATLLNTIYVRKAHRKDKRPVLIDARHVIEEFKDMVWMEDVKVEKLALFRMGAKQIKEKMRDENGEREVGTGRWAYVAEEERSLSALGEEKNGNKSEHVGHR